MVNLPSFRQLEHLVMLADHGHFGHAAMACQVTQSTLSASIKELENVLQAPLVDRTKRRVVLTPLGLEIVERARRILNEGKDLVEAARAGSEPLSGTLRMGVIATVGPFLLPDVLPRLRRSYPALRLYLVEDLTARLVEELRSGKLDIVLLALPNEDCRNLETQALFLDPFKVALPNGHPLAAGKAVDIEQLRPEELLLLKEGHCLRDQALAACRLADRRQVQSVEATGLHTLVQMVDNGLGVTLLPQLAIDGGILKGTAIRILPTTGQTPSREIGLVWRRGTGRQREFMLLANVLTQLVEERSGLKSIFPLNSLEITHLVDSGPLPLFSLQERKELKMNRMNHSRIETKNTLPQSIRIQSVGLLNRNLALAIDLERQAKQAHWNVKGPNFIALHELFDKVAEAAEEFTDLLAERATALGGTAEGRVHAVAESSSLPRYPGEIFSGQEHGDALSTAMATFGKAAREAIDEAERFGDADTADVFTGISRETDKQLWLVEAHLYS